MQAIQQLLNDISRGQSLAGHQIVQLMLLISMVTASIHLVTMLVTRWGDRHVAAKSLAASLLVHCVCFLGLSATSVPAIPAAAAEEPERQKEERVSIRQLVVESDQAIPAPDAGNTLFDRLVEKDTFPARLEQRNPDFDDPAALRRSTMETLPTDPALQDIPEPADARQASIPEDRGVEGPRQPAAASLETDADEVTEARAEVTPNTPGRLTQRARVGDPDETVQREVPDGSVRQIDPQLQVQDTAPAMTRDDENAEFATDPGEIVKRSAGPVLQEDDALDGGVGTDPGRTGAAGANAESRVAPMRTRVTRRSARAVDDMKMEREPQTPLPLDHGYEVRVSPALNPMSDSIDFQPSPIDFTAPRFNRRPSVPATYRLRVIANREEIARRNGGTEESEQAVEMSLAWLARMQHPDGYWDADRFDGGLMREDIRNEGTRDEVRVDLRGPDGGDPAGTQADTGVTALAVLAYLGAGYTHEEGKYSSTVRKAVDWLISVQGRDGNLFGSANRYARMYCHAMATYALAEASGMQSDPNSDVRLQIALLRAVSFISGRQHPGDGGWRYVPGQEGDVSMFGWQMMALKSAEVAGVPVAGIVKERMARFLKSRRRGVHGGLTGYRSTDPPDPTMTAEALFCRQMLGYPRDGLDSREAVDYLMENQPTRLNMNLYYWYYGTLSMYQYGGREWEEWNERVRNLLIAEQTRTGRMKGSWNTRTRWGPSGGRIYTTAVATMTLEVYYRFLPLYRAVEPPRE